MTFLNFVFHELLGPPAYGSSWFCPWCNPNGDRFTDGDETWASLSVLPPRGSYPIKFKCHWCGVWGDEHDLIRKRYPGISSETVGLKVRELLAAYGTPLPTLGEP